MTHIISGIDGVLCEGTNLFVLCHIRESFAELQAHYIYVVVGISNSILSILTANFPDRIEKKKFV